MDRFTLFFVGNLRQERLMACYTCTSTEESSQCQTNPATLPHAVLQSCPRDVCTIVRVEEWPSLRVKLVQLNNKVISIKLICQFLLGNYRSFYRGCDGRTKVFERNNCQIEKDERTCFTSCVGDLCNLGDGLVDDNDKSGSISMAVEFYRVLKTIGAVLVTFYFL